MWRLADSVQRLMVAVWGLYGGYWWCEGLVKTVFGCSIQASVMAVRFCKGSWGCVGALGAVNCLSAFGAV